MSTEKDLLTTALADRAEGLDVHGPTMGDVVGRAHAIRRKRRVATGVATLAMVAILAPGGLYVGSQMTQGDTDGLDPAKTPSQTPTSDTAEDSAGGPASHILDGVWHRADGTEVELPRKDYQSAVVWNDRLVATYFDGEVFFVADVITADGTVSDSFGTTGPVVVNEERTTIAWVDTDGSVITRWGDGQVEMGSVDLSAAGETIAFDAAAVTGGPDCHDPELPGGDGCMVYVNGQGDPRVFDSHGTNEGVVPGALAYEDVAGDTLLSVVTQQNPDTSVCSGVYDRAAPGYRFRNCDFYVQDISPDGTSVAALPTMYDGLGLREISIVDADTGEETGRFAPEGENAFVAQWAWSDDGRLVFATYDGANWHLMAMASDGELEDLAGPVKGPEMDSPFTLIRY